MFKEVLAKLIGSYSEREVKKLKNIVDTVLNYESEFSTYTDEELKGKTESFKKRLEGGTETLDDILPEAFATVREASWRVLGMKPYPVQVLGGIVLHQGRIAEMKTGEGKTLVATMPVYLNALTGKGVFVVTVNEYLATRDSQWMGKIYSFLGLSVGLVTPKVKQENRKEAYACDITYCTNNEVGFDYLKDNMVATLNQKVQRSFNYAIVDEVDSILIDEARTPLILSAPGTETVEGYKKACKFALKLHGCRVVETDVKREKPAPGTDYVVEEKHKTVILSDEGVSKVEYFYGISNLGDIENLEIQHDILNAIKAKEIFKRDVDYVVKEGKVVIVDPHTGRLMDGRRYSEGIHQAIEAKEGLVIQGESKTLASITFQNLFRKFPKLSGMTGTALTEEKEFRDIYGLDIVEIPTNKPIQRIDKVDKVFATRKGKLDEILKMVKECNAKGQPILIGTASVEASEELAKLFKKSGIRHTVLNAKFHEKEANIIAQAGKLGAVTIATNMAGRGTDIILGGNVEYEALESLRYSKGMTDYLLSQATMHNVTDDKEVLLVREKFNKLVQKLKEENKEEVQKVLDAGGLYILGTERHESRRIDNQLRGRAGRQGDVGVSEFIISFEDDLMRIFGANKLQSMFKSMNIPENVPVNMKIVANSIEGAQKRVESQNFAIRKQLFEYDSVMVTQRDIVYTLRDKVLANDNLKDMILHFCKTYIEDSVKGSLSGKYITMEDQDAILDTFVDISELIRLPKYTEATLDKVTVQDIINNLIAEVEEKYETLENLRTSEFMRDYERKLLLYFLDTSWQEHMLAMEDLRQGVGLKAYGQMDPLIAYKTEGFDLFNEMMTYIKSEMLKIILQVYSENVTEERCD